MIFRQIIDSYQIFAVKGVAKIARKLGFDFAEAVVRTCIQLCDWCRLLITFHSIQQTGFEFKKRRAFPVIEGVVVAIENEATLLEVINPF